jgi:hypothetical protein
VAFQRIPPKVLAPFIGAAGTFTLIPAGGSLLVPASLTIPTLGSIPYVGGMPTLFLATFVSGTGVVNVQVDFFDDTGLQEVVNSTAVSIDQGSNIVGSSAFTYPVTIPVFGPRAKFSVFNNELSQLSVLLQVSQISSVQGFGSQPAYNANNQTIIAGGTTALAVAAGTSGVFHASAYYGKVRVYLSAQQPAWQLQAGRLQGLVAPPNSSLLFRGQWTQDDFGGSTEAVLDMDIDGAWDWTVYNPWTASQNISLLVVPLF